MFRFLATRPWLITMLCVVLLGARVSEAHLHLCFDGQEPPVSLHFVDVAQHHPEPSLSAPHHDEDVSLFTEAVAKSGKLKIDLPVMLFVVLALLLATRAARTPFARRRQQPAIAAPAYLHPPLRGPPLTAG